MLISLLVGGAALPIYTHEGASYAAAPESGTYEIEIHNPTPKRQLAIITVDGVNVVDGEDGKLDGCGYILAPWKSLRVPGFTRTNSEVAAFTFARPDASYAAQTGRGQSNVGVVGLAVFDERERRREVLTRTLGGMAKASAGPQWSASVGPESASRGDVGTAYGARKDFDTRVVAFERASAPHTVTSLRYATREQLRAWGVPVDAPRPPAPNPFPAEERVAVKPPPGWAG